MLVLWLVHMLIAYPMWPDQLQCFPCGYDMRSSQVESFHLIPQRLELLYQHVFFDVYGYRTNIHLDAAKQRLINVIEKDIIPLNY